MIFGFSSRLRLASNAIVAVWRCAKLNGAVFIYLYIMHAEHIETLTYENIRAMLKFHLISQIIMRSRVSRRHLRQ